MDFASASKPSALNSEPGATVTLDKTHRSEAKEEDADNPVQYTLVTGRTSRAKKGVYLLICDVCRPAKRFARAADLRCHQLSHRNPEYTCTFEDCERAFHRRYLLAHHMHQHETQGEKAYKACDQRDLSLSPSVEEYPSPKLKVSNESSDFGNTYITSSRSIQRAGGVLGPPYEKQSSAIIDTPRSLRVEGTSRQNDPDNLNGTDPIWGYTSAQVPLIPLFRIPDENWTRSLTFARDDMQWCSNSNRDSTFSNYSYQSRGTGFTYSTTLAGWPISDDSPWTKFKDSGCGCTGKSDHLSAIQEHNMEGAFSHPLIPPSSETALHKATRRNYKEVAKLLLDRGADPNSMNENGSTPLHVAAEVDALEIAEMLVKRGSNLDAKDKMGRTAMHCAADGKCEQMLRLLTEKGAPSYTLDRSLEMSSVDCERIQDALKLEGTEKDVQPWAVRCSVGSLVSGDDGQEEIKLRGNVVEKPREEELESRPSSDIPDEPLNLTQKQSLRKLKCSRSNSPSSRSESCALSDPSAGFETDSISSGEGTEWGEDESVIMSNMPDILKLVCDDMELGVESKRDQFDQPMLSPFKRAMVERLMEDFWTIFNREWLESARKCAGSPSTPSSASALQTLNLAAQKLSSTTQKRHLNEHEDLGGDDGNNPKRQKDLNFRPESPEELPNFACPYRKHDPRKYSHLIQDWRSCALTSFSSVARVKGHLYRRHRIFQCERCSELFKTEDQLKSHFMAAKTCDLKPPAMVDGITCKLEKQLRSRKKTHSSQSQADRWKAIYQILFPLEIIPSPNFEPIQEETSRSPGSTELSNYEEYSRRELPRVFRGALEDAINNEAEPIVERLRSQLVSMIQECQERVFGTYRSRMTPDTSMLLPNNCMSTGASTDFGQISQNQEDTAAGAGPSTALLGSFFEAPPYQSNLSSEPMLLRMANDQDKGYQNEHSDSGYISNPSESQERSSPGTERPANLIVPADGSDERQTPPLSQEGNGPTQPYTPFEEFILPGFSITSAGMAKNSLLQSNNASAYGPLESDGDFVWDTPY